MILSLPADAAVQELTTVLKSADARQFALALSVGRELQAAGVTQALVRTLEDLQPARQTLVLTVLADRADPAARPAVVGLLHSEHIAVRIAAIRALAALGDADSIHALLQLDRREWNGNIACSVGLPDVNDLSEYGSSDPGSAPRARGSLRLLLIQVSGRRRITAAVPLLLDSVGDSSQTIQVAAIRALGETIDAGQLTTLIDLHARFPSDETGRATHDALRVVCARFAGDETCGRVVVAALTAGTPDERPFLLELLALIGGPTALHAVGQAALDPQTQIQDAATRLLGQWRGADAAPVLFDVAKNSKNEKFRIRALRGYIRIVRTV